MNKTEYDVLPLFSKVFYIKTLDYIEDKELNNIFINCKKQSFHTINKDSYIYSKTSSNRKILDLDCFSNLKTNILKEFNFFKNDVLRYVNTDFKITTSWVTKTKKNQFSLLHNHNNSMFSGIFYVDVNENQHNISFENFNRPNFFIEPDEYNIFNSYEQTTKVKNRTLIIFPSEIHHSILKNEMTQDRYSIAFNILPNGRYGRKNTDGEVTIDVL